jgi:hypothetical protein
VTTSTTAVAEVSFAQERRLRALHERGAAGPAGKNIPLVFTARDGVDTSALVEAVRLIVERHPVLRMRFVERDGAFYARRVPVADVPCPVVAGTALPATEEAARALVRKEVDRPFEAFGWPLLRVGVVRTDPVMCYVSMDHLISDGWSQNVALADLREFYREVITGRPAMLPPAADPLRDVADERRRFAVGAESERRVGALLRSLGGRPLHPPFGLPTSGWRTDRGRYREIALLDAAGADEFIRLCRRHGATPFMGALAAIGAAQAVVADAADVGFLVALHNRESAEAQRSIGWYANMLPLYFQNSTQMTHTLRAVRVAMMGMLDHHDLPLARALESPSADAGPASARPSCFVSFSDDRQGDPGGSPQAWERQVYAASYRAGYGLWISWSDLGMYATVASPDPGTDLDALEAFEAALVHAFREPR